MNTMTLQRWAASFAAALCLTSFHGLAADNLPKDSRLAIIGDSITEQKLYSKYMEAYLLACQGRQDVKVFQYGWGGETAGGFAARLENDLAGFQPTVATTCYGMNDGQYRPFGDDIGRPYEANMRKIVAGMLKAGVKTVVIGSPGAVDTRYFVRQNFAPLSGGDGYNKNLAALRDIDRKIAADMGQSFADVHQPMVDTMAKAKATLGDNYDVCGRDGVHPGPNGQLIMAYAFLRALGCDGNIAKIIVDLQGSPSVSPGHKVLSGSKGELELESIRYPFCFDGDEKSSGGTRSITGFFPFNDELNRFTLKVNNLESAKAKVSWGGESKEFTREQLTKGINLAAEFIKNPFSDSFKSVLDTIARKQNFETLAIKSMITNFRQFTNESKSDAELAGAFKAIYKSLMARQAQLDEAAHQAVIPVKHNLSVIPIP